MIQTFKMVLSGHQLNLFLCILSSRFSGCSSGSKEAKPYINEFFFKLTDENLLTSVQKRASNMQFLWQKKVNRSNTVSSAYTQNV